MAIKAKTVKVCAECQNPFRIAYGSTASICPNCIANKNKDINKANTTDLPFCSIDTIKIGDLIN